MNVLLGISGGISAYKACDLIRGLQAHDHSEVRVIMTDNAKNFITEITIATLSGNPVINNMWTERASVEHIDIGKWSSMFVVYPATANVIAKFANGIADDYLTTSYLASPSEVKKMIFPAMNTHMLNHKATRRNIETLKSDGVFIGDTEVKTLACGDFGDGGVMAPRAAVDIVVENINRIRSDRDLA